MKRTINRCVSALVMAAMLAAPAAAQDASRDWKPLASSLKPGARVELDLADGTHIEGTVLGQEVDLLVVGPRTRIPVKPWRVGYSEIRSIEVKSGREGMRPGTKVLIGIGVGLGAALVGGLIAVASSD